MISLFERLPGTVECHHIPWFEGGIFANTEAHNFYDDAFMDVVRMLPKSVLEGGGTLTVYQIRALRDAAQNVSSQMLNKATDTEVWPIAERVLGYFDHLEVEVPAVIVKPQSH